MLPRRVCVCVCVYWNNAAWQIFEDSSSPAAADPSPAAAQVAVVVVVIVQLGIGYKHIIRSLVSHSSGLHCAGVSDGEWAMNLLATFSINLSLGMCQTLRFDSSSSSSSSSSMSCPSICGNCLTSAAVEPIEPLVLCPRGGPLPNNHQPSIYP